MRNVQKETGSVDAYATQLSSLAKRVNIDDATLLYAFVSVLGKKLVSFILGKNPVNIENAINDARVAEISLGESARSDTGFLSQQVTEMRRDLQKLAQRYDSIVISAPIQRERSKSPAPRVTFQEPPVEVGRGRGYAVLQAIRGSGSGGFGQPHGRGRGYQVLQAVRSGGRKFSRKRYKKFSTPAELSTAAGNDPVWTVS